MKGIKMTSIDDELTWLQLNAIAKEVLTETMVSKLRGGIANGEESLVRIETTSGLRFFKTYIYRIGDTVFIDAAPKSDPEVFNECSVYEVPKA